MTPAETALPSEPVSNRSTPFIVDLTNINLDTVLIGPEKLAQWNPHRGAIVQLDGIVWHNENFSQGIGVKFVRHDEFWVAGHFPGRPLLPGVLMVEAAAQCSSYLYYRRRGEPCLAGFTRIDNTVFRRTVAPGEAIYLLTREVEYRPRRFISDVQGVVDGKIAFQTRVTGMVI